MTRTRSRCRTAVWVLAVGALLSSCSNGRTDVNSAAPAAPNEARVALSAGNLEELNDTTARRMGSAPRETTFLERDPDRPLAAAIGETQGYDLAYAVLYDFGSVLTDQAAREMPGAPPVKGRYGLVLIDAKGTPYSWRLSELPPDTDGLRPAAVPVE